MKLAFIFKRKKCLKFGARLPNIYIPKSAKGKQVQLNYYPLEMVSKYLLRISKTKNLTIRNPNSKKHHRDTEMKALLNSDVIFQKIASNTKNDDEVFEKLTEFSTNKKQLILDDFLNTKFLFDRKLIYNFLNETFNQTDLKYSPFDYKVKVPKFEIVNENNFKPIIDSVLEIKKMKFPLIIKTVTAAGNFNSHLFFIFFSKKSLYEFCVEYFDEESNQFSTESTKEGNKETNTKHKVDDKEMNKGVDKEANSSNGKRSKIMKEINKDCVIKSTLEIINSVSSIKNNTTNTTDTFNKNINGNTNCKNIGNASIRTGINTHDTFRMLSPSQIFHNPKTPGKEFILQQYYKHHGALIKACVIGRKLFVTKRTSIPDLTKNFHDDKIFFHNFFKGSVFEASGEKPDDKTISKDIYDVCYFIKSAIQDKLKIGLFGFDVIFEDKIAYIIDINYFPTFKEVEDLGGELVEYAREKYSEYCKLNNITNIL